MEHFRQVAVPLAKSFRYRFPVLGYCPPTVCSIAGVILHFPHEFMMAGINE
jgi:hypothetical protein